VKDNVERKQRQHWKVSALECPARLVTSREYVSLQLQKQGGPCVLRLVHLSLKWGVIALRQKSVRNVRKEGLNWKVGYIGKYPREIVAKIDFRDLNTSVYQLFPLIVDR